MALTSFAAVYWLLLVVASPPWQLATGLLFLALWLAPRRRWPWVALVALLVRWAHDIGSGAGSSGVSTAWGLLLEPVLVAGAVFWLRRKFDAPAAVADPKGALRFLLSSLLLAVLLVGRDMLVALEPAVVVSRGSVPLAASALREAGTGAGAALVLLGDFMAYFTACLLVVPLGAWACERRFHPDTGRIIGEVLLLVPLALVLMGLMLVARESEALVQLLRLSMLAGVVVSAMRHGWRGAALSLALVVGFIGIEGHLGLAEGVPASLQLSLGLVGALALMSGGMMDGFRRQAHEIEAARHRLSNLAEELHEAAMRNLTVEERERQRLAGELHDEFGQNLAALQTHLTLSLPAMEAAGRAGVVEQLLDLTRQMQQNIGRVLDSLRPAALDELGLFGAIDRGSLRRLAEDSGLVFETRLEGDARLLSRLSPIHRVAAFRMAQGAVTNVVRHANARHCWLRLRANARGGQLWLFLDVRDDGDGRLETIRAGNGLSGLQDRVIGLGGRLVISQRRPGLRVHVVIRQALQR